MGCCGKDSGCSKKAPKRKVPWFSLLLVGLLILVAVNWQ